MNALIVIIFIIITLGLFYIRYKIDARRNFDELLKKELKPHGFQLVKSEYPGLLKVGPFKKIEVEIGKPQINRGAIQYERTYYRKLQILTNKNQQVQVWAKIETGWFKSATADFIPNLNEIERFTA